MEKKVQYNTLEERENLINENKPLILVEEQNLFEGNFLIFSDVPRVIPTQIIYTEVPKESFDLMQKTIDDLILGGAL
ncbi:hypothetical protein [Clostridium sp. OS1-26]|uniref:hypothetical protein n=1 Tax=Clostridium sp. OS1-26 TaxID=3070681 RepID=UPI0027E0CC9A|nr:hypothetical protein [Clostridium sp. OS1-26]WML35929.1 hypothetical protein RCG18_04060 [Clostridium sp. OS1-26]